MNLEIHRPDIGGKADQISPVFTAAPRKDAAVSSGLHAPVSTWDGGTSREQAFQLRRSRFKEDTLAQARKQRNLLDSP
ncbi:MAG: hypothetical protein IJG77_02100 [Aeriscardovia sp.]|nr:hypothetical protein [Aeriscardovia sp.]